MRQRATMRPRKTTPQRRGGVSRVLAMIAVLAMVLAACADADTDDLDEILDDEEPAEEDEADADPDLDAEPDDTPDDADGSTFIYAVDGVPDTLDMWTTYQGDPSRFWGYGVQSKLVNYDTSGLTDQGCEQLAEVTDLTGELAESWEFDEDENAWIFTLREGVQSPDGNTMTAEDVKWSFDRAQETSNVVRFLMFDVADYTEDPFEVVDDQTLMIRVNEQTALDVAILTWHQFMVFDTEEVRSHATDDDPWANEWLIENWANFGPWQLDRFDPGNEIVHTQNPNYWNADNRGDVETYILRSIDESSTRVQLLQTGEIDVTQRVAFDQFESLQDADGVEVRSCVSPNRDDLMPNHDDPALGDPLVRQALSLAIDREVLAEGPYRGFGDPSRTGLPDFYDFPEPELELEHDPDRARELLAEAGAEDLSFTLTISPSRPGAHAEPVAVLLQSMWADIGVDVDLEVIAGAAEFSDRFFDSEYQMMMYNNNPAVADPFYSLNLHSTTVSFQNTHNYDSPAYDELTLFIGRTEPGPERDEAMVEVSDLIVEDLPVIDFVDRRYVTAWVEGWGNYNARPHGEIFPSELVRN